jgi:hypothetical protein
MPMIALRLFDGQRFSDALNALAYPFSLTLPLTGGARYNAHY